LAGQAKKGLDGFCRKSTTFYNSYAHKRKMKPVIASLFVVGGDMYCGLSHVALSSDYFAGRRIIPQNKNKQLLFATETLQA